MDFEQMLKDRHIGEYLAQESPEEREIQRQLKSIVFNGTHGTVPWNRNEPIPVWIGK